MRFFAFFIKLQTFLEQLKVFLIQMLNSDTSDSEADEGPIFQKRYRLRRLYEDPSEFRQRFRFTPRQVELLLQIIGEKIKPVRANNNAINEKQRLLIALRFYA